MQRGNLFFYSGLRFILVYSKDLFCSVEIFFLDLRFILGVVWGFILFSGDSFIEWRFMLCIEEIYCMYSPGIYFGRVA